MSKPKIEAIYPLTFMQQALLLHALYESKDQGFLHVKCILKGKLDQALLQQAWQHTLQRHSALRTSIHWEKIEKPMQVVHPQAQLPWSFRDWRHLSGNEQQEQLQELIKADQEEGLNLSKAPVSRLSLIQIEEDSYYLLWSCHHILLDGWSAAVILRDVLQFYDSACKGEKAQLEAVPSYRTYLNWMQRQDLSEAQTFWQQTMDGFDQASLIGRNQADEEAGGSVFKTYSFLLSSELTQQLQAFGQQERLTLNTIVQGVWAMLLSGYQNSSDVVFGTTVSGRSAALPNMDLMAGLFMNVLPIRAQVSENTSLSEWFQELQKHQMRARNYEHVSMDQILSWINWSGASSLFDSLLVFENFPWEDLQAGEVVLKDFEGGLTSTYPLTIVVKPGQELTFLIRYHSKQIGGALVKELSDHIHSLIKTLATSAKASPGELLASLGAISSAPSATPSYQKAKSTSDFFFSKGEELAYTAPQNALELQLTKIWEEIFGRYPIGVEENFFQIGGNSLLAVRLFARIEQQWKRNLPPVTLLQHPTIKDLAKLLKQEDVQDAWSTIVPIRASGSRLPLFCIHAGGAHVFFYNAMAYHLGSKQPVYAIQPMGLDGVASFHDSIEEMAGHYLKEIRNVQPEGPYALLGTCFSNAVCFEMAKQLEKEGQSVSLLAIIDSPVHDLTFVSPPGMMEKIQRIPVRIKALIQRFRKDARGAIAKMIIAKRNKWRDIIDDNLYIFKNKQAQNLIKMQDQLADLYLQYKWEPYSGKVTLIRSRQFHDNEEMAYHITQWEEVVRNGVELYVVEGRHDTLFDEPEVQNLARQLQQCLDAVQPVQV